MNLIRENSWIIEHSKGDLPLKVKNEFFKPNDDSVESFYYSYPECKHMSKNEIMEYDFGCIAELKSYLEELWENNRELYCMIPAILSGADKFMGSNGNMIRELECYNYIF